ncbi:MAG: hypothetical protein ACK5LR_02670 [Mangrovibacterium sp.]
MKKFSGIAASFALLMSVSACIDNSPEPALLYSDVYQYITKSEAGAGYEYQLKAGTYVVEANVDKIYLTDPSGSEYDFEAVVSDYLYQYQSEKQAEPFAEGTYRMSALLDGGESISVADIMSYNGVLPVEIISCEYAGTAVNFEFAVNEYAEGYEFYVLKERYEENSAGVMELVTDVLYSEVKYITTDNSSDFAGPTYTGTISPSFFDQDITLEDGDELVLRINAIDYQELTYSVFVHALASSRTTFIWGVEE